MSNELIEKDKLTGTLEGMAVASSESIDALHEIPNADPQVMIEVMTAMSERGITTLDAMLSQAQLMAYKMALGMLAAEKFGYGTEKYNTFMAYVDALAHRNGNIVANASEIKH